MGMLAILLLTVVLMNSGLSQDLVQSRPNVVILDDENSLVFHSLTGALAWTTVSRAILPGEKVKETKWNFMDSPAGVTFQSNPVTVVTSNSTGVMLIQDVISQVYATDFTLSASPTFGKWVKVSSDLPHTAGAPVYGYDSISAASFNGYVYLFARTMSNQSQAYWCARDNTGSWTDWSLLGGSKQFLMTDLAIAYNSFTQLQEAFMVSTDGYLYRSWQLAFSKWSLWDRTGDFPPKSRHAPVVQSMGTNFFNGQLNVFVHGDDGNVHHIWQTTCDKVPNPWGWCTWSAWYSIGGSIPATQAEVANTLSIGHNIHLGIELFVVDQTGHLYKMWQLERNEKWSTWEIVKGDVDYNMACLPGIVDDPTGWWAAYALSPTWNVFVVTQPKTFSVSPSAVPTSGSVTAVWIMPEDEATNSDWIGVYPRGVENHLYVDYYYVGGSQNPLESPVPSGKLTFTTFLPDGNYDIRYLANRRFIAASGSSFSITTSPTEEPWLQVFRGIFTGWNMQNISVATCVKDAQAIEDAFEKSFAAFEDRAIFDGLNLLGLAIGDVVKASSDCGIVQNFIDRLKVFISDLSSCVKGQCLHFLIDVGKEILVLYENMYEIYGDIVGASNSFKIKAYTQGGYNVGRVVGACLALPR